MMTTPEDSVRDIMTTEVKTLDRNQSLDLADNLMVLDRIRHLPVLDDGRLVGVVSQRDLFRSALAFALGYGERARETLLKTFRAKTVMSSPAVSVAPETTIREAALLMLDKKIGCLPVVEEGRLVGLVAETDIIRHLVEG